MLTGGRAPGSPGPRPGRPACRGPCPYVREHLEPEDIPQPVQRGRLLANDEVYMVLPAGPVARDRRSLRRDGRGRGDAEPRGHLHLSSGGGSRCTGLCRRDPLPRPPGGHIAVRSRRRTSRRCFASTLTVAGGADPLTQASSSRSSSS